MHLNHSNGHAYRVSLCRSNHAIRARVHKDLPLQPPLTPFDFIEVHLAVIVQRLHHIGFNTNPIKGDIFHD